MISINLKKSPRQRIAIVEAWIQDTHGDIIMAVWFNQPFLIKTIPQGSYISLAGSVEKGYHSQLQMNSPEYEKTESGAIHTGRMVPIYSVTKGVTQKQIRFLLQQALTALPQLEDFIPNEIVQHYNLIPRQQAIQSIHFPLNQATLDLAVYRLKFEELFLLQMVHAQTKQQTERKLAPNISFFQTEIKQFVDQLPFALTTSQKKSAWEILLDCKKQHPMNRLLQGDVGSGKTVVAAIAMYNAILNGYQAVLMAPTEILARQHFQTLIELFATSQKSNSHNRVKNTIIDDERATELKPERATPLTIALLTNSEHRLYTGDDTTYTKKEVVSAIGDGTARIIVGTHALIQDSVTFNNTGLIIIDEQHRFGVEQRAKLSRGQTQTNADTNPRQSALNPHFLSMTATPIPRSLALTVYGDLDISVINEMPKNRKQVITKIVSSKNRNQTYEYIKTHIQAGRQVFVICPLIEAPETQPYQEQERIPIPPLTMGGGEGVLLRNDGISLPYVKGGKNSPSLLTEEVAVGNAIGLENVKAAIQEYEKLSQTVFQEFRVGLLHGKMKPKEKEIIQRDFQAGIIDILVATSVVEVGVHVPNATVMMIEGADRFGLAQLHQFRGRVGRAEHQSYCFLFAENYSQKTRERLHAMETIHNGFELAEIDLQQRGPGDFYGIRQSGLPSLKIASLTDYDLIKTAHAASNTVIIPYPNLDTFPLLKMHLATFQQTIHLE